MTVVEPRVGDDDVLEGHEPLASYIIDCRGVGYDRPWYDIPQQMSLWNVGSEPQRVTYSLTTVSRRRPLVENERGFGPRDLVYFEFREPDEYRLQVRQDQRQATVAVPRRRFDCNVSRTYVTVPSTDGITAETVSTALGCPFSDVL